MLGSRSRHPSVLASFAAMKPGGRTVFLAGGLLFLALGASMMVLKEDKQRTLSVPDSMEYRSLRAGLSLLHTGDIVLRTGRDITSYMFAQMNPEDKTYSHCGVAVVEHGVPWVYHSVGGGDNPDQRLRRDRADQWFSPAGNTDCLIVRFPFDSSQTIQLAEAVAAAWREGKKFDLDFDLDNDDRYYCSEMVYKMVNRVMGDTLFLRPRVLNGRRYAPVDQLFLHPLATRVWEVHYK